MNTKEMTQEQISALADGELADEHVDIALAALLQEERRGDWELYHQIGDVLRSDDMAVNLSPGFSARLAARLEMEPTIIAPAAMDKSRMPNASAHEVEAQAVSAGAARSRRWKLPSMVGAAAVAAAAFITTPHLMVAFMDEPAAPVTQSEALASATAELVAPTTGGSIAVMPGKPAVIAAKVADGVVLRDPRIDDYLLAHQRFSPSVYSSAQYARSAAFATNSNK